MVMAGIIACLDLPLTNVYGGVYSPPMSEQDGFVPILETFGPDEATELTDFDRELFAGFHDVSDDFYPRLFSDGATVIGHRDKQGKIISVAALYTQSLSDPEAPRLERQIPAWACFLDGAAVDPQFRKSIRPDLDLHGELLTWRLDAARQLGKAAALTVVRADNIPSDRNLRRKGWHALLDAPGYYGPRPEDGRIAGAVLLQEGPNTTWPEPPPPTPLDRLMDAVVSQPERIALTLPAMRADAEYRFAVGHLLQQGYTSYYNKTAVQADTIPFTHLEVAHGLDEIVRSRLITIRSELRELV